MANTAAAVLAVTSTTSATGPAATAATTAAVAGDTANIGTGAVGVTPREGDGPAGGGGGPQSTATKKSISAAHSTPSTRGGIEERIDGSEGGGDKGV